MRHSSWHYALSWIISRLYYRIRVSGAAIVRRQPTLFIASHRNGALDGYVYAQALGAVPALVSLQLLRHFWQRLLFTGIPVVRDKDCARYGVAKNSVPSPITAAVQQLQRGGSLLIFPEGSSEFLAKAQPYHAGMAMIAWQLKKQGIAFQVQAVGSFYSAPERFRSRVSLVAGAPFVPQGESVRALAAELGAALDSVSVNCANTAEFNTVQRAAFSAAQDGADYGQAFLRAQAVAKTATAPPSAEVPITKPHWRWQNWAFALIFLPLTLAASKAAQFADGRNNESLFRMLGVLAALPLQLLYFGLLAWLHWSIPCVLLLGAALLWHCLPEPAPLDL